MLLTIDHQTTYSYDEAVVGGLQQLRLTPQTSTVQRVLVWETIVVGGTKQVTFKDHHANTVELVSFDPQVRSLEIRSVGQVETIDTHGIVGKNGGLAPLWLFRRSTHLTSAGPQVRELADNRRTADGTTSIELFHNLTKDIADTVTYTSGTSRVTDSAEEVMTAGQGVCQDHAHILISAARHLGQPARYVSGYLHTIDQADQADQGASHAWAEVWLDDLGWVGFDPSNGISPDEQYVRIATGLDYAEAAPISGIRFGSGVESLEVSVQIQQ